MVNILDTGTCESGISAGKRFYIQEFLQGKTFSQHLRDKKNDLVTVEKAFETVVSELVSSVDEHRVHTSDKAKYVRFLSRQVKSELSTISQLPFLGFLANCQEIVTNGIPYRGLNEAVKIILSADHLNEEGPPIGILSDLGHWNFHGDNIIINDLSRPNTFRTIDPDVNINMADPLFGLARFLYTFPHDTVEMRRYWLESKIFFEQCRPAEINVRLDWPAWIQTRYRKLFDLNNYSLRNCLLRQTEHIREDALIFRFQLNYLFCLLRGISANQSDSISFQGDSATTFQNGGMFLLLEAVRVANVMSHAQRD